MKVRFEILALALVAAGAVPGCAVQPASTTGEKTSATSAAIEGGKPVNSQGDVISTVFPLSTVFLLINKPGGIQEGCTGVVLSSVSILTAAHCAPVGSTPDTIFQYSQYTDAKPGNPFAAFGTFVLPPGVLGAPYPSGVYDSSGNFADLAILNLESPLPGPNVPVSLSMALSYAQNQWRSSWEVGAGSHNGQANPGFLMDWAPVILGPTDTGGFFTGSENGMHPSDDGDSGGPLFQTNTDASGNPRLYLLGICSSTTKDLTKTVFTSVTSATNYAWIMSNMTGTPPSPSPSPPAAPQHLHDQEILPDLSELLDGHPHSIREGTELLGLP